MTGAVSSDTTELRQLFDHVPLFAAMAEQVRADVWDHAVTRTAPSQQILVSQGAETKRLLVLLEGEATSIRLTSLGREVSIGRWIGPVVIDKVTTFAESEHPASVHADTTVKWCTIPVAILRSALELSPSAQLHAISKLASSASSARHAFVDAAVRSSLSRLARWLVVTSDLGVVLNIPRPQERLAQQLGMSRVTLNRAIHQLAARGLIEFDGSLVAIVDEEHLRILADL